MNKLISLLVLLVVLSGCSDLLESSYANYDEVVADNAIRRGWIPIFLPKSASNIQEIHNLENNEIWLVFNLKSDDYKAMVRSCNSIPMSEIQYPSRAVSWWPDALSPDLEDPKETKPESPEEASPSKETNNQKENKPSDAKKSSPSKEADGPKKRQSEKSKNSNAQKESGGQKSNSQDKGKQNKGKQDKEKQNKEKQNKNKPDQDKQDKEKQEDPKSQEAEQEETYQFYRCDRTTQYANSAKKISAYLAVTEDRQTAYYWRPGN